MERKDRLPADTSERRTMEPLKKIEAFVNAFNIFFIVIGVGVLGMILWETWLCLP